MKIRHRTILILLTAAFALRGLFLILVLPIGDPLDELFHFGYAEYVAATGKIPHDGEPSMPAIWNRISATLPRSTSWGGPRVSWKEYGDLSAERRQQLRTRAFSTGNEEVRAFSGANYETQQPPAMYLLAAPALRELSHFPENCRLFAGRLLAVAFATAGISLSYLFFRRLFPKRAALGASLVLAAFPGTGPFTSRFTNDDLALPIAAALLGLLADVPRGRLARTRIPGLALLLAAGAWTKIYFLAFFPAAPLAALFCRRAERRRALLRSLGAAILALLLISPWLIRQHSDTGDWLGLTETKAAARAGIGFTARIAAIPGVIRTSTIKTLISTFVFPGTWSAMGAPRPTLWLAAAGMSILFLLPGLGSGPVSRSRRLAWFGASTALLGFAAAEIAHDATFAAISDNPWGAGGEGWYFLILLPVVLAAGALSGRAPAPRIFPIVALLFVLADAVCTFGRLAAVYAGRIEAFDPSVPWSRYGGVLLSGEAFTTFSRVGLISLAPWMLCLLAAAGPAALAIAATILVKPAGLYARVSRRSANADSMSPRAASRSGAM